MENKVLLSICIPTYNREPFLKESLDSIINQNGFENGNIEVIISDNASTDNTNKLVNGYLNKYDNIYYFRNEKNLGFDFNLDNTIVKANGKYCLILGDDDGFLEGSLNKVIEVLEKNNITLYFSNGFGYDYSFKQRITLKPSLDFEDKLYNFTKLKDFIKTIENFPLKVAGYFGGMSGKIFLREKWINYKEKNKYIGSNVIHFYTLLHVMKNEKFCIIGTPIIKIRGDNLRNESFGIGKLIDATKMTIKGIKWFNNEYNIGYSRTRLYRIFILAYLKNWSIIFIKKYILKDSKKIYKVKTILAKYLFIKI